MAPALLSSALASLLLFELAYSAAITPRAVPKWGDCTDPSIAYVKNMDGLRGYGYKPVNQKDFPHGAAQDITAITDFICGRLKNECLAPEASSALCRLSALAVKIEKDQKAADDFNEYLKTDGGDTSKPKPKPTPKPKPKPEPVPEKGQYNIETRLSAVPVVFDSDIDLRWWFDNRMETGDASDGAICPRDPINMGDGKVIQFNCNFPDTSVEKLMRAAMNELIQTSVTNASIPLDQKPFARYEEKPGGCNRVGCPKPKPRSKFPSSVEMALFNLTGRSESQGSLFYEIIDTGSSGGCGFCDYFGKADEARDAMGKILGGKLSVGKWAGRVGPFTGFLTLGCSMVC